MASVEYSEDGKCIVKTHGITGHFVVLGEVTSIGRETFLVAVPLTNIEIPNSVTEIGRVLSRAVSLFFCHLLQ